MIDIIIPIYNSRSTLPYTLMSILTQKISCRIKVTLVDDCSIENYDDIIKTFDKYIKINYIKLNKNSGSAIARQKGLDNTNYPYVVFIDSDDLLYNTDSLNKLYKTIKKGYDIVISAEYDEEKNMSIISDGDLHGKIYKRDFINKKKIRFNNTRFHEDNYFNNYVLLSNPKKIELYELTYLYCRNINSITKVDKSKEFERLEILISNMKELESKIKITSKNIDQFEVFLSRKYIYLNNKYKEFNSNQRKVFKSWIEKYDSKNIDLIGIYNYKKIKELIHNKIEKVAI